MRNDIHFYDARLDRGARVDLPEVAGWHAYLYVFSGAVELDGGTRLGEAESAVITGEGRLAVAAEADALLVAFLIDPDAKVTRAGTIGR